MNKSRWLGCALSAMVIGAGAAGLNGAARAEEAAKPETTAPSTGKSTTQDTTQATRSYRGFHGWRRDHHRYAEQRKAVARARQNEMERWRGMRRWWNNPEVEERRMWNKARSRAFRDMADARWRYHQQFRPPHYYGYGEWSSYRYDPWY